MIEDINEHVFPNGGWAFRQPQTNWENPMRMVGFKASVEAIVKHRLANRAITAKHGLATDPRAVADELKKYTRLRLGIPLPAPPSFFRQSSSLSSRVVSAAAAIKTAAQGMAIPVDWFQGGGMPVALELAERRAGTCVPCDQNKPAPWYVQAGGRVIKELMEARSDIKLETSKDDLLKGCEICHCLTRVKVHTPLDVILSKTKPEVLAKFPSNCWIARRDQ